MRNRFEPPMPTSDAQLRSRAFLALLTRAAFTDSLDRVPDGGDFTYWIDEHGQELLNRGPEINYKRAGHLAGLWYFWDRAIGWQATGKDAALYGPFATPPNSGPANGWTTAFVDVEGSSPVPDPEPRPTPTPTPTTDVVLLHAKLEAIQQQLGELAVLALAQGSVLRELREAQTKGLVGSVAPMNLGFVRVPGFTVRLTPPAE